MPDLYAHQAHALRNEDGVDRLQVSGRGYPGSGLFIGSSLPLDPSKIVRTKLAKTGGSTDMIVDGTTPVEFKVSANPTNDIVLYELRIVFTHAHMHYDGVSFGKHKNALANGILIDVIVNNGQAATLATIKIHEDLVFFASNPGVAIPHHGHGPKDLLITSYNIGGAWKLIAGSGDLVRITIRDKISDKDLKYFQAEVRGVRV